jgi:hypothetical protein
MVTSRRSVPQMHPDVLGSAVQLGDRGRPTPPRQQDCWGSVGGACNEDAASTPMMRSFSARASQAVNDLLRLLRRLRQG